MLQIDTHAKLESPIHRLEPRTKLIGLFALMVVFASVQQLWLIPFVLGASAAIFAVSRLPFTFLLKRLRYPGLFVLAMVIFLPVFVGETLLFDVGILSIKQEGVVQMLLVVGRFMSIVTLAVVMFATAPLLETLKTMQRLGTPRTLTELLLLTFRYIQELGEMLRTMQRAMRLRGFRAHKLNRQTFRSLGSLMASLLIRSYETSEQVYNAMRLRGYGLKHENDAPRQDDGDAMQNSANDVISLGEVSQEQTPATPALEVKDLNFAYSETMILENISLEIAEGARVGVIGPNGTGKSSLFRLLTGILAPQQGEIKVFGEKLEPNNFRSDVGLVFQNPSDQLFSLTVHDDVAFGPQNLGLAQGEIDARVDEALQLTGTNELAESAPHHLSGGQRRMVAIATALSMRPKLVLYDEPDANLDMRSRRRLINFLQTAAHTLMLASHDLEMILEVCDRVILLDEGRIIADGKPEEVMRNATLMEAHGLEKPHSLVPHVHQAAM